MWIYATQIRNDFYLIRQSTDHNFDFSANNTRLIRIICNFLLILSAFVSFTSHQIYIWNCRLPKLVFRFNKSKYGWKFFLKTYGYSLIRNIATLSSRRVVGGWGRVWRWIRRVRWRMRSVRRIRRGVRVWGWRVTGGTAALTVHGHGSRRARGRRRVVWRIRVGGVVHWDRWRIMASRRMLVIPVAIS